MLEWVLSLLLALAAAGAQGVTNAQDHQAAHPAPDPVTVSEDAGADEATDAAARLADLVTAIQGHLATAATHANANAQDALEGAAGAAEAGLTKAADAVANHGQPADAGAPDAVPAPGDHPTGDDHPNADDHPGP